MQDLKVTVVQTKLHWADVEANLEKFTGLLATFSAGDTDLVVLPETFSTGFIVQPETVAETMNGSAVAWMLEQAKRLQAVVTGSLIIEEAGKYYNRLIWARPDGSLDYYNKRHRFSLAQEDKRFTAGKQRLIVELKGWKVCPLVCYDLRFPVWCRNRKGEFDLQLFVANWPDLRSNAWRQLLVARAIENQAYVVGVNRTGHDGNGIYHAGYSGVIDPAGENAETHAHEDLVQTYTLSAQRLQEVRQKLPFLNDADEFTIHD